MTVRVAGWLLLLAAVALFAHGCHTGDHDDEPTFVLPWRADR